LSIDDDELFTLVHLTAVCFTRQLPVSCLHHI